MHTRVHPARTHASRVALAVQEHARRVLPQRQPVAQQVLLGGPEEPHPLPWAVEALTTHGVRLLLLPVRRNQAHDQLLRVPPPLHSYTVDTVGVRRSSNAILGPRTFLK